MKRLMFYVMLLFVLSSRVFVLAADQVEITKVSGDVQVLLENTEDYESAQEGMSLKEGDKLKTSAGATAELSFNADDSNIVSLSENSNLTIILKEDEKLDLSVGEVFATVSNLPAGSAFEIRTPTAVSGARGTDWVTKVSDEGTDVEAIDSIPYVRHFENNGVVSQERTLIQPGQMTKVKKFNRPMPPQPIMEQSRQKWQSVKKDMGQHIQEARIRREQNPRFDREKFIQNVKERNIQKRAPQDMMKMPIRQQNQRIDNNKMVPVNNLKTPYPIRQGERVDDRQGPPKGDFKQNNQNRPMHQKLQNQQQPMKSRLPPKNIKQPIKN